MRRPVMTYCAVALAVAGVVMFMRRSPGPVTIPETPHPPAAALRPPLHPVVARIVRDGVSLPYLKFNYLIKELPTDLAPHDIEALIVFISSTRAEVFREGEWGSLVNDIEEALTVQTVPSPRVAAALGAIYRDSGGTQMQRDYALQHLGGFAMFLIHTSPPPEAGNSAASLPTDRQALLNTLLGELRHATTDPAKPWAGTALNLLDGVLRAAEARGLDLPGLDPDALCALAIPIATAPDLPLNSRLPALQVAARRGSPQAAPLARSILADPDSSVMLVQSAAGVLSQCGGPDDLPILQQSLVTASRHTAPAIANAIQTLSRSAKP